MFDENQIPQIIQQNRLNKMLDELADGFDPILTKKAEELEELKNQKYQWERMALRGIYGNDFL